MNEFYEKLDSFEYHLISIGVSEYKNHAKLNTAASDAEAFRDILVRKFGFSSRKPNTTLLQNSEADSDKILTSLRNKATDLGPKDILVIYFAGHGVYDQLLTNQSYIIGYEGSAEKGSTKGWVPYREISAIFSGSNLAHVFFIVDACFSGGIFRFIDKAPAGSKLGIRAKDLDKRSRLALTSGGLEVVNDSGFNERSVFANRLIQHLEDCTDKIIRPRDIFNAVEKLVIDDSPTDQEPKFGELSGAGDDYGNFAFSNSLHIPTEGEDDTKILWDDIDSQPQPITKQVGLVPILAATLVLGIIGTWLFYNRQVPELSTQSIQKPEVATSIRVDPLVQVPLEAFDAPSYKSIYAYGEAATGNAYAVYASNFSDITQMIAVDPTDEHRIIDRSSFKSKTGDKLIVDQILGFESTTIYVIANSALEKSYILIGYDYITKSIVDYQVLNLTPLRLPINPGTSWGAVFEGRAYFAFNNDSNSQSAVGYFDLRSKRIVPLNFRVPEFEKIDQIKLSFKDPLRPQILISGCNACSNPKKAMPRLLKIDLKSGKSNFHKGIFESNNGAIGSHFAAEAVEGIATLTETSYGYHFVIDNENGVMVDEALLKTEEFSPLQLLNNFEVYDLESDLKGNFTARWRARNQSGLVLGHIEIESTKPSIKNIIFSHSETVEFDLRHVANNAAVLFGRTVSTDWNNPSETGFLYRDGFSNRVFNDFR